MSDKFTTKGFLNGFPFCFWREGVPSSRPSVGGTWALPEAMNYSQEEWDAQINNHNTPGDVRAGFHRIGPFSLEEIGELYWSKKAINTQLTVLFTRESLSSFDYRYNGIDYENGGRRRVYTIDDTVIGDYVTDVSSEALVCGSGLFQQAPDQAFIRRLMSDGYSRSQQLSAETNRAKFFHYIYIGGYTEIDGEYYLYVSFTLFFTTAQLRSYRRRPAVPGEEDWVLTSDSVVSLPDTLFCYSVPVHNQSLDTEQRVFGDGVASIFGFQVPFQMHHVEYATDDSTTFSASVSFDVT